MTTYRIEAGQTTAASASREHADATHGRPAAGPLTAARDAGRTTTGRTTTGRTTTGRTTTGRGVFGRVSLPMPRRGRTGARCSDPIGAAVARGIGVLRSMTLGSTTLKLSRSGLSLFGLALLGLSVALPNSYAGGQEGARTGTDGGDLTAPAPPATQSPAPDDGEGQGAVSGQAEEVSGEDARSAPIGANRDNGGYDDASRPPQRLPRYFGKLHLDIAQRESIYRLQDEFQQAIRRIETELAELRQKRDDQLRDLLSRSQQEELDRLITSARERRRVGNTAAGQPQSSTAGRGT